ncbi:nickel ABC transporter permease [Viridibacillus sp. FSL R5-0477]|uniref:Glutathione transport system permease protein GsiC n=1 Tax=Viridibacillus arenosi FSL R5-213 TaxID=1227360 RepID=W4ELU1_9BACL|nr:MULTISPECIES: nickel ABC transporter permease [Viridibacillus]ETT81528.1 binding-protein-dependent transport systems inner membrane component [Viridibacillus arenosi FSL R5-213]OMC79996.1 glutathione ABC transporter permease GsiC [Viridibacillus sp. FSL H8-0123]OMC84277.1 glutathione ABC transporter permease GsiC [Viridibacillus sp. FSL H7-0596]OMC89723.1 glutathione ABC transporter permease GsiC [Viridibacillus arenosi]
MLRYIIKRVLEILPIIIVVSILSFLFIHFIPGDPARLVAGKDATLEDVQNVREELGLNDPIWKQYISYMGNLLQGNLGTSLKTGLPVSDMFTSRFMPSIYLTFFAMIWATIIGLLIGTLSAVFKNKWPDYLGMVTAVSGISLPGFWLGLLLIQLFSVQLGILPTGGSEGFKSYILPSLTLGAGIMSMIARFTRSSLLETLQTDYIRTGRAKGLKESVVIIQHALRNSLIPVVTIAGLQFGFLLGGSVVVETVFSFPGMGRLLIDSIAFRDYPVIQSALLLFAIEFIIVNLVVDILYSVLNPKIQVQS